MSNKLKNSFFTILLAFVLASTAFGVSDTVTSSAVSITEDQTTINTSNTNTPKQKEEVQLVEPRGLFCQPITFTTQNGHVGDGFGSKVEMDGDVVVISAPLDNTLGEDAGAIYVFRKIGTVWIEEQKLLASDGQLDDQFGVSVAMHNGVILVGTESTAAYIFTYVGDSWQEQTKLTPWDMDNGGGGGFGESISIHNGVAVIGAYGDSSECALCGSAYIFRFDGTQWVPEAKLVASDAFSGPWPMWDYFGMSVGIVEDFVIVGKPREPFPFGYGPGALYVFRFDGSAWNEEDILLSGYASDRLGWSISIDGDNLIAGAPGWGWGAAYTFQFDGQSWNQTAQLHVPDWDNSFGRVVVIGNQFALVSAGTWDGAYVTVFSTNGQTLSHLTTLYEPSGIGGYFGTSVALFESNALIGSIGAAYLYDLVDDTCNIAGDVTGDGLVNVLDLLAVIDLWGPCSGACLGDLNGDSIVGVDDLLIVIANWD